MARAIEPVAETFDAWAPTAIGPEPPARTSEWGTPAAQLALYAVTVFFLVSLNFFLPRLMPGDPISALYVSGSPTYVHNDELRATLRAEYGLDEPIGRQYVDYLAGLAQADLGTSIRFQVPVSQLLAERLPRSLLLLSVALTLGTALGMLAGITSGWRRGRHLDRALLTVFISLRDFPIFFLASIALFVFAVKLRWFPISGASTSFASFSPLERIADVAYHLALPAAVLATAFATRQFLLMRAAMVAELGSDHLLAGRVKGLRDRVLEYRYAARNALLPSVSLIAIHFGTAITFLILVETVFAYQGVGRLVFDAIAYRDYPALQAAFLVLSLIVVVANFLADVAYRRLDPRTTP